MTTEQAICAILSLNGIPKGLRLDAIAAFVSHGANHEAVAKRLQSLVSFYASENEAYQAHHRASVTLRALKAEMSELWIRREAAQKKADATAALQRKTIEGRDQATKEFRSMLEELAKPAQQSPASQISPSEFDIQFCEDPVLDDEVVTIDELEVIPGDEVANKNSTPVLLHGSQIGGPK